MTPEDIEKKLAELGIKTGAWREGGGVSAKSPIVERQKELMSKLAVLLEEQIENDVQTVAMMQEKLTRLKHGGGR